MTAASLQPPAARLVPDGAGAVLRLLEGGAIDSVLRYQHFLRALDHGEFDRFAVWPEGAPRSVLYAAPGGTVMAAGDAAGGPALAPEANRLGWRVLLGDEGLCGAVLDALPRRLLRRPASSREQRFMVVTDPRAAAAVPQVAGLRRAELRDVDVLTDFACRLHVEDQMGPPIPRSGIASVRARMLDSVGHGLTWVVDPGPRPVAKVDVALSSRRRGAQIAGV
jgi:uncharacterized protein